MPGRGVSLTRSSKSDRKCGHKVGKICFQYTLNNKDVEPPMHTDKRPTVMRSGYAIQRELEVHETKAHQIVKITEFLVNAWSNDPHEDEQVWTKDGRKFKPKYKPEERFALALQKHFECICIAANILPSRCSWEYKND